MLYLIILSTLSSDSSQNVAVLSCAQGGVTVAGGGRMLCSLRSQVLKAVYSLYGITKTKQNKLSAAFFLWRRET